jgi:arginyl-tRNA synthetase
MSKKTLEGLEEKDQELCLDQDHNHEELLKINLRKLLEMEITKDALNENENSNEAVKEGEEEIGPDENKQKDMKELVNSMSSDGEFEVDEQKSRISRIAESVESRSAMENILNKRDRLLEEQDDPTSLDESRMVSIELRNPQKLTVQRSDGSYLEEIDPAEVVPEEAGDSQPPVGPVQEST